MRTRIEASLEHDPLAFYFKVLDAEAPRLCGSLGVAVQPGQPWPPECGASWTYDLEGVGSGALLAPPSPSDGRLTVRSFARVGSEVSGLLSTYLPGGLRRPLIHSAGDLNLDDLSSGTGLAPITGPIYALGSIDIGSADLSAAPIIATETGFTIAPQGSGPVFAAPEASEGPPVVHETRYVYPSPYPATSLQSALTALAAVACLDEDPENHGELSSSLCLRAGATVVTSTGDSIIVPAAAAYLLIPDIVGTVEVFSAPSLPELLPGEECAPGCVLGSLNTASHPGTSGFWGLKLGTFNLPASGVIHTDQTTFLGLCDALISGGACVDHSGSSENAARIGQSFTLVVGDISNPKDVLLSGPLHSTGRARIGVVSSGDVLVPYWAASALSATRFDVLLASAGRTASPLRSIPSSAVADPRPAFTITGGALLPSFSVVAGAFSGHGIGADGMVAADPPPLFPAPSLRFERVAERRLTPGEHADLLNGAAG